MKQEEMESSSYSSTSKKIDSIEMEKILREKALESRRNK